MREGFQIVPVTNQRQVAEMVRLAHEIWPRVYAQMISAEQIDYMLNWMYDPDRIWQEIESENVETWLIGDQMGFCSFGPVSEDRVCPLHKLYIHPDYHRQGLGLATLRAIELFVRNQAAPVAEALSLRVNRGNSPAIGLYEAFGFERVAEDCADIGGGFTMDDYIFRKNFRKGP